MSSYISAREPIGVPFPTGNAGCCGGGGPTGAQAASSPQETRADAAGGVNSIMAATSGAANALREQLTGKGRGPCRCWWVALAAVVVIALVANKS